MPQVETADSFVLLQHALESERQERILLEKALEDKNIELALANQMVVQMVQVATEKDSLEKALQECLDTMCYSMEWPIGHVYIKNQKTNQFSAIDIWHCKDAITLAQFEDLVTNIPNEVAREHKPVWLKNISKNPLLASNDALREQGIKGIIGLPIKIGNEVIAVLEFFLHTEIDPDGLLLEKINIISKQLSQMIDKKGYQQALKLANNALDSRVQERNQELLETNLKLEKELQERQRLESQLVQSEKMASLGQLAAGVAHEINNPIGFVMSNIGTLEEYLQVLKQLLAYYETLHGNDQSEIGTKIQQIKQEEDLTFILEDLDNLLGESKDGIQRVKEIVQNLKSFSRVDEGDVKETDINECIETTLKIVWNELKYNCQILKDYGNLPIISAYPGPLNQVFMNLLVNAAQAIPEQGEIRIKTETVASNIVISISDTGQGIPKDKLQQIFDPFFTTKPIGQGTGLGLSIVYGIIKKHNGDITVESSEGKGTTFTIHLPIEGVAV